MMLQPTNALSWHLPLRSWALLLPQFQIRPNILLLCKSFSFINSTRMVIPRFSPSSQGSNTIVTNSEDHKLSHLKLTRRAISLPDADFSGFSTGKTRPLFWFLPQKGGQQGSVPNRQFLGTKRNLFLIQEDHTSAEPLSLCISKDCWLEGSIDGNDNDDDEEELLGLTFVE